MQKFTRPLTREIELAGERLALTLSAEGISVRPVGSRKPPRELSWSAFLCHLAGHDPAARGQPTSEEVTAALESFKAGAASKPAAKAAPPQEPPPAAPQAERQTAPAASPTTGLLGRLERWFGQHRPRYQKGLLAGANAADLTVLEKSLGHPVPPELQALLSWHNGQSPDFVGHFEQDWDLMNTAQVVAAKRELEKEGAGSAGWQPSWIPFLTDDSDNYVFLDTSQAVAPVRIFWEGKTDNPLVAASLNAWLEDFVNALERGDYQEDPERGSLLRRGSGGS